MDNSGIAGNTGNPDIAGDNDGVGVSGVAPGTNSAGAKTRRESYTEQVHIITQANLNGCGRLFGGQLMSWIDITAAVVARRHSGYNVTTASVSWLDFSAPAYADDTIVLCGYIVRAGRTSMDICVKTYVESLDGTRHEINTAYLVMVALDECERPAAVPGLLITSPEEQRDLDQAEARRNSRRGQ